MSREILEAMNVLAREKGQDLVNGRGISPVGRGLPTPDIDPPPLDHRKVTVS